MGPFVGDIQTRLIGLWARHGRVCAVFTALTMVCASVYYSALPRAMARGEARTISLFNPRTKENLTVTYKRDGRYDEAALGKINYLMRDWRLDRPTRMDPALIDLLWELHEELGSNKPIHLVSGFRSAKTNAMLRRRSRGVAKRSMHINGRAADVFFPDVPVRKLRESALLRERGGVGYYPRSGKKGFVHIDTGRVRHWPRMNPIALASLFKNRGTKHRPGSRSRDTLFASRSPGSRTRINLAQTTTPTAKPFTLAALQTLPIPRLRPRPVALVMRDDAVGRALARRQPLPKPRLKPVLLAATPALIELVVPKPRSKPIQIAAIRPIPRPRIRPVRLAKAGATEMKVLNAAPLITASLGSFALKFKRAPAERWTPTYPRVRNAARARREIKQDKRLINIASARHLMGKMASVRAKIAPGLVINRTRKGDLLMSRHGWTAPTIKPAGRQRREAAVLRTTITRLSSLR